MEAYPSLKQRLSGLLADESTTDVTFLVGEDKFPIRAHSQVLTPASDAFKNMLYGEFNGERTIEVPDCTPDGFRAVLSYVYTDAAQLSVENVASTMYLSNKYFVTGLYRECIDFIKDTIDASNVWRFLEHAKLFDDLNDICEEVLQVSGAEVLMSQAFLNLSRDAMSAIVTRNDLAANETLVYERAVEWAKRQLETANCEASPSQIRTALGDALYLIRFPVMEAKEFAGDPAESGILTDKECVDLYAWFTVGKKPSSFCTEPRVAATASIEVIMQDLGLRKVYECPHVDQLCFNANIAIDACNAVKNACSHMCDAATWICLRCLKTACRETRYACGMPNHAEAKQHNLFLSKNLHCIYCTACQKSIAQK